LPTQNIAWVDIAKEFDNQRQPNDYRRRWLRLSAPGRYSQTSNSDTSAVDTGHDQLDSSNPDFATSYFGIQSATSDRDTSTRRNMSDLQLLDHLHSLDAEDESEIVFASIDRAVGNSTVQYASRRWSVLKKSCPTHIRGFSEALDYLLAKEIQLSSASPSTTANASASYHSDRHQRRVRARSIPVKEESTVNDGDDRNSPAHSSQNRSKVKEIMNHHNAHEDENVSLGTNSQHDIREEGTIAMTVESHSTEVIDEDDDDDEVARKRRKLEKKEKKRMKKEKKRRKEEKRLRRELRQKMKEENSD
jgi:hypothetical protein